MRFADLLVFRVRIMAAIEQAKRTISVRAAAGYSGIVGEGEGVGVVVGVAVGAWVGAVVGAAVGVGVAAGALTVTVAAVEVTAAPVLSVTWSLKFQLPVAVDEVVAKL